MKFGAYETNVNQSWSQTREPSSADNYDGGDERGGDDGVSATKELLPSSTHLSQSLNPSNISKDPPSVSPVADDEESQDNAMTMEMGHTLFNTVVTIFIQGLKCQWCNLITGGFPYLPFQSWKLPARKAQKGRQLKGEAAFRCWSSALSIAWFWDSGNSWSCYVGMCMTIDVSKLGMNSE